MALFTIHTSSPISIHALREEGDLVGLRVHRGGQISIHALREEGDFMHQTSPSTAAYFYPRPPRGGRLAPILATDTIDPFLSTPSARRATIPQVLPALLFAISIHALREEGDQDGLDRLCCRSYFYPRPPRGGRHHLFDLVALPCHFYPRPPRGGRQQKQRQNLYFQTNYTTFCTNLEEP